MAKKDLILIVGVDDKGTPVIRGMARKVGGDLDKLDKKARKTGKGFNQLKKDVDASGKGMSKFKGMLKSTMVQMAAGMGMMVGVQSAVRALKNVVTDFIKTGREFEKSWANVTTMLSISDKATEKLKNQLIGLSPTLGSVTEMAKGMYQVLSASIEPAKAIEFLGVAAKAAVAGVTDVFTSVDALTTVINAYGFAAEDATRISDIMFQTVKRGKLTFGELSSALGTVVPTAAQLGIRFEEIAAGMATLTRQGINVNTVTMQLRQVMMSVLKPTSEAKVLAEKLGIEFTATALKAKGLSNFLAEITEKTGGNVTIMGEFFSNIRALSAVFGLAGNSAAEFAYDISLMEASTGSTEVAFKKQMKTLDFWIRTAGNALEDMKVAFYEGMVNPIREVISSQKELDEAFESLTNSAALLGEAIGSVGNILKLFQPIANVVLKEIGTLDKKIAIIVQGITFGLVPAWSEMESAEEKARIETALLGLEQKELTSNMKGIWGVLSRGALLWKKQVDYYIDSGMAVEEYLPKLLKLWKGKAQFQKQSQELAAMDALDLQMKKKLSDELDVLQGNIEVVIKSELAYTKTLENHVKKAMLLAEITGQELSPAVRKLAEDLDLYKKKSEGIQTVEDLNLKIKSRLIEEQKILTGVIDEAVLSGDFYESTMKKHVQSAIKLSETTGTQLSPTIVRLARQFGIATNQMLLAGVQAWRLAGGFKDIERAARETNEFLKKHAVTMPVPTDDPWLSALDRFSARMLEKLDEIKQYGGLVANAWDGMWNQMYQNQIQRIDNEYQARKQAIDDSMDSDQAKYFAIEKLDREMQAKRLAAQRKHAKASKLTSLFSATVATAEAVAKALTAGPFLGPILAAIIGALGAAQIAMIASAPLPSFAKGGVAGLHGPEVIMVGEEGPERITPLRNEQLARTESITKTGDRSVLFEVSYYITSPDALGVRDFIREKAGPELIEWIRLNKTEMLEALELG